MGFLDELRGDVGPEVAALIAEWGDTVTVERSPATSTVRPSDGTPDEEWRVLSGGGAAKAILTQPARQYVVKTFGPDVTYTLAGLVEDAVGVMEGDRLTVTSGPYAGGVFMVSMTRQAYAGACTQLVLVRVKPRGKGT